MAEEKIKQIRTGDIIPYINNAKIHDSEQVNMICASIREFGFAAPCLVDEHNNLIAGHGRLMAAKKLGLETVPCRVITGLTEAKRKALILADNKIAEAAVWDNDTLQIELEALDEMGVDMSEFGFELDFGDDAESEQDITEDQIPETPTEPKAKRGQIYKLGRHRLLCGDSTSEADIEKLMDGQKANMVYTDPPYGMNLDTDYSTMKNDLNFAKDKRFTSGRKYDKGIVDSFNPDMINKILDLDVKETFLWGADYYAELLPNKNNGSWIVWDKRANGNDDITEDYSSDKMYGSCFELCWSKNRHKRDIARVKWAGVFGTEKEFDRKRWHPTQKPVKLVEWFLARYSKENDIVIDLFGGSGSTLIACEQTGRTCYTMELDEKYVDVIIERWENLTGQQAELVEG